MSLLQVREYLYITNNLFFYIECDFFILYSHLGIIKIKNHNFFWLFIVNNIIYNSFFYPYIFNILNSFFLLINYGFFNKFKLIGVGYRQFYCDNIVVYKLRYSHLIYNVLPLEILSFKKRKRKKFFILYSLDKEKVNSIINKWMFYRISNVYTKKGFFKRNKFILFKEMIKKLF